MTKVVDLGDSRHQAARVASCADLIDIRLLESSSDLLRFHEGSMSSKLDITPSVNENAPDHFIAHIKFDVRILASEGDEAETEMQTDEADHDTVATVSCTFGALYHLSTPIERTDEELSSFVESVGMLALYPYARAHVQATTTAMGLPGLVLPILRHALALPVDPGVRELDAADHPPEQP